MLFDPAAAGTWRSRLLLGATAAIGIAASAVVAIQLHGAGRRHAEAAFAQLGDRAVRHVAQRLQQLEYGLRGARGVVLGQQVVEPREWQAYLWSRELPVEFPGALGFGFAPWQPAADGRPARAELTLFGPGAACRGVDLLQAGAAAAVQRAMATGAPALSEPVALPGSLGVGNWYVLPVPWLDRGENAAPRGFVAVPLVVAQALAGVLGLTGHLVDIEVWDRGVAGDAGLLLGSQRAPGQPGGGAASPACDELASDRKLRVGGRPWQVRIRALPAFAVAHPGTRWWPPLAVGLTMTGLLVAGLGGLALSRTRAQGLAGRMTEALRHEQARLEAVQDCSPLGVLVADLDGRCTYANRRLAEIVGVPAAACRGDGWLQTVHHDDRTAAHAAWRDLLAGDRAGAAEFRWRRDGGGFVWAALRVAPVHRGDQRLGFVGTLQDVTSQHHDREQLCQQADSLRRARDELDAANQSLRQQNEQLQSARAAAEAATRAKSAFLANMSHELRTPMTAILGFAQCLAETYRSPAELTDYLGAIVRNGEHMLALVNAVLDFSKIEAGKMTVEQVPTSPVEIVRDVAETLRHRAVDKGLQFAVRWRSPVTAPVLGDPVRLRQILMNLVGNAVKFTSRGEVAIEVEQAERAGSPWLAVRVVDTGKGISEAQQARLFQAFTQADESITRQHGGTGLGLSISRQLAQLLGGDLTADCRPGHGCTFELALPVRPAPGAVAVAPEGRREANGARRAAPRLGGRVLVVDDGPDNRRLIGLLLQRAGAEVEVAADGQQGVDLALAARAAGRAFDLVLMDMQMPVLDGIRATAALRAAGVTTPIAALTANVQPEDRARCLAAGCNAFLTKPVERELFFATCAELLAAPR